MSRSCFREYHQNSPPTVDYAKWGAFWIARRDLGFSHEWVWPQDLIAYEGRSEDKDHFRSFPHRVLIKPVRHQYVG